MRTFKSTQQDLQARIVREVRRGRAASRGALADALEIAPSTMGIHVEELARRGFLTESGVERGPTGRPKRILKLISGMGWFAGVEFTGGRLQAVRLDFADKVQKTLVETLPVEISATEMVNRLIEVVNKLREDAQGLLLGLGVGAPGFVNPANGEVVFSLFQPDWNNMPLADTLRQRLKVRVTVENNLHAITLAEQWFGDGRDEPDFVVVRARNGFGLGVVKEGRLLPGAHHATGELGLLPWPLVGAANGTHVHDVLAARKVWARLSGAASIADAPLDLHNGLLAYADAHGAEWEAVVTDYARVLGIAQLLLDARVYFLHGPLRALGERFCDEIVVRSLELAPALRYCPIDLRPSKLGKEAGALGAASLAMEAWNPDEPV